MQKRRALYLGLLGIIVFVCIVIAKFGERSITLRDQTGAPIARAEISILNLSANVPTSTFQSGLDGRSKLGFGPWRNFTEDGYASFKITVDGEVLHDAVHQMPWFGGMLFTLTRSQRSIPPK
jgi:hypothetical protein